MAWTDTVIDPTRNPSRRTRPTYIPPHLRNISSTARPLGYSTESSYTEQPRFTRFPSGQPSSHRRASGGRDRGRFQRLPFFKPQRNPNQDPFDIAEKFDELDVIEEGVNNGNSNENAAINFDAYEDIPVEVSGSNVPPPVNNFTDIDLGEGLNGNIKRCKYAKPTPIQKHALPILVAGRDLMACAQTGSGKTAAFCFPIIHGIMNNGFKLVGSGRGGTRVAYPSALILSPTRELSCQIHEEAKKFSYNTGVKIVVAYGGAPIVPQFRNLEKGVDILVATPGRLLDMLERAKVSLSTVKYLALDEADQMLDMGFEPQIRKIVQQMGMPAPGERQTMLFSATFPQEIQRLASDFLSNYIFLTVGRVGSSTDLIAQKVELVQDMDKKDHLVDLLHAQMMNGIGKPSLTLVFVETKKGADALEHWLFTNGFSAIAIHGDKVQMERERALKSFKSGATPIMVATDVASRGLDIPHVSHVINFDLPKDIDVYVHRIGRTGRAGKSGLATAFFSDKNMPLAKALVELMKEASQEVPLWLNQYAENSSYCSGSTKRHARGKFGGYDFRNDTQSGLDYGRSGSVGDSYDSHGAFGHAVFAATNTSAVHSSDANYAYPVMANYCDAAAADHQASHGWGLGHESIVATGWD